MATSRSHKGIWYIADRLVRTRLKLARPGLQVLELKTGRYDQLGKIDYAVKKHATA